MEPAAIDEASSLEAEAKQAIQAHVLPLGEEVARLTRGAEGEAAEALAARLGPPLERACEVACAALAGCVVGALPSLSEQRQELLQEKLVEVAMEALHHGLAPALANGVARAVALPGRAALVADAPFVQSVFDLFRCSVCQDTVEQPVVTFCGHSFCAGCFDETARATARSCPNCKTNIRSMTRGQARPNAQQQALVETLTAALGDEGVLDWDRARAALTCEACKFVLHEPLSLPSGHNFCRACWGVLSAGDGAKLAPLLGGGGGSASTAAAKLALSLRATLRPNTALGGAAEALFPEEAARVPEVVRLRKVRGQPLDGAARERPPRPGAQAREPARKTERKPELSSGDKERLRQEKKDAKVAEMVAQGKDVFTGERRSLNMPDLSGKLNDKGEPLQRHLISCHLCTQGPASWNGAFTQPIGCKECDRLYCARCIGNIMRKPYRDHREEVDAYIQANLFQYTCLHCRKQCACQAPEFAASRIRSSRSDGERQLFVTEAAHPFAHGDDVSVRGHTSGSLQDKELTKGPFLVVVASATSFALKKVTGRGSNKQSRFIDLGPNGTGGQVRSAPCPAPRSPPNPNPNPKTEHRTPNTGG